MARYGRGGYGQSSGGGVYSARRSSGGGWQIRILIAGAIILFSLVSYYSSSQVNPVTGEKQRVALNPEQEIAMGLQAAPQMVDMHGGELQDAAAQGMVDAMGAKLLRALDGYMRETSGTNPYQFDFHLLADPRTINAFALPGGQVFITAALFSKLETEGQLAGVLGHEIGHVLSRHGAQRLAKQKLTAGLTGAVGVAGGTVDSARMAQAIGQMISMKYGREDELESDKWGVLLSARAGYDPRAMLGVMDILAASGGEGPPEMMSTHPKPANRKAYIEDVIETVYPEGLPDGLEP
jgi:beta-barrel assembly-enhancing protease